LHRCWRGKNPPTVVEEIAHLQADRLDDALCSASGMALDQDPAVISLGDGKRGIAIMVGWAEGHEVAVVPLNTFEASEQRV
jgi:hypothetical protein